MNARIAILGAPLLAAASLPPGLVSAQADPVRSVRIVATAQP